MMSQYAQCVVASQPSRKPPSASSIAPEQAVASVAPAPWQRARYAISGRKRPASGSPGGTAISGTHATSGSGESANVPSGTIRTPLATSMGARVCATTRGRSTALPGSPDTIRSQSRPAEWKRSRKP